MCWNGSRGSCCFRKCLVSASLKDMCIYATGIQIFFHKGWAKYTCTLHDSFYETSHHSDVV